MLAPCERNTRPRRMALAGVRHTLSRYHESGERLMTPMIEGSELNGKCLPLRVNSLTLEFRLERCASTSVARFSRVNIGRTLADLRLKSKLSTSPTSPSEARVGRNS